MSELIKMQFVCAHELLIVTVRKRSCGKVMFLHLSVSHSVHRGGCLPQCMLGYNPPGKTPPRHHSPGQKSPPLQTATAADATHPTGMHSCWIFLCVSVGACTQTRICIEPYEDTMHSYIMHLSIIAGSPGST